MFGVLGKGRETHLREFAFICGSFSVLEALGQPENGDLDRKWTQMDANGDWEQPEKGIFGRKTGKWGRKTGGGRVGNYEIREKREKRAENRSKMVKNGRFGVF